MFRAACAVPSFLGQALSRPFSSSGSQHDLDEQLPHEISAQYFRPSVAAGLRLGHGLLLGPNSTYGAVADGPIYKLPAVHVRDETCPAIKVERIHQDKATTATAAYGYSGAAARSEASASSSASLLKVRVEVPIVKIGIKKASLIHAVLDAKVKDDEFVQMNGNHIITEFTLGAYLDVVMTCSTSSMAVNQSASAEGASTSLSHNANSRISVCSGHMPQWLFCALNRTGQAVPAGNPEETLTTYLSHEVDMLTAACTSASVEDIMNKHLDILKVVVRTYPRTRALRQLTPAQLTITESIISAHNKALKEGDRMQQSKLLDRLEGYKLYLEGKIDMCPAEDVSFTLAGAPRLKVDIFNSTLTPLRLRLKPIWSCWGDSSEIVVPPMTSLKGKVEWWYYNLYVHRGGAWQCISRAERLHNNFWKLISSEDTGLSLVKREPSRT